jgi:hypothetical protein
MYFDIIYTVKCDKGVSNPITSNMGVKQGCVCSPTLFNIYLNDIGGYLDQESGHIPEISGKPITHLLFADDLVIFSLQERELQEKLCALDKYCSDWKLKINLHKTKIIVFNSRINNNTKYMFKIKNTMIEQVQSYTYLGPTFSANGGFKLAMSNLRGKALRAWFKLKQNLCTEHDIPTEVLLRMYNAVSKQINLYASEIWGVSIIDRSKKCNIFHNWDKTANLTSQIKIAKSMLDLPKKATNIGTLSELGQYPIQIEINTNILKFYGRLKNMDQNRLVYKAFLEDSRLALKNPKVSLTFAAQSIMYATSGSMHQRHNNCNTLYC